MNAVESLWDYVSSLFSTFSLSSLWDGIAAVGSLAGLLLVFAFAVAIPTSVGWAILGPINKAAGRLRAPTRFFLSDFLWLVVQLQIALAYCGQFVGVRQQSFFILVLGFLVLATGTLWAGGVSFLSRAGVNHPPRRAAFILVLLPATLTLMMVTTLVLLVTLVTSVGMVSFTIEYRTMVLYICEYLGLTTTLSVVCLSLLPALGYLLRRLSRWVVSTERRVAPVLAPSGNSLA